MTADLLPEEYCGCSGRGANDPMAVYCAAHEALDDAVGAIEHERTATLAAAPCPCWLEAHPHGGHCCFRPASWIGGGLPPWLDGVLADAVERDELAYCHDEEQAAEHRARLAAS